MFFLVIINSNWEISTKNLVTILKDKMEFLRGGGVRNRWVVFLITQCTLCPNMLETLEIRKKYR